jgi:hypothetical protein
MGDDRDIAQVHDEISIRKTSESGLCRKPAGYSGAGFGSTKSLVAKVFGPEPTVSDVTRSKTF